MVLAPSLSTRMSLPLRFGGGGLHGGEVHGACHVS
jgi:hypothetical protein